LTEFAAKPSHYGINQFYLGKRWVIEAETAGPRAVGKIAEIGTSGTSEGCIMAVNVLGSHIMNLQTPRDRFAINLREARRKAAVSQQDLGDRCDLHRTEISLLERGGREPRLGTIVKLSSALGVSPESLCVGMRWDVNGQRFKFTR
jgi:DNA-binding XRE family transcriptional regulator